MRRVLVLLIFILAFLLRVVWLDRYPTGFTPDEAAFGYDAYSLLKTGKDQWGESWPLTLRSFGDFKLPLYAYLTIPSVALFGLSEFAVRLPNAVLGTLAVLATYLLAGELFRRKNFQLFASSILAISPWHISLSRGAFEANLTTFFLPLGVYAFLRGLRNHRWMAVTAIILGLNLFTYHSARFVTPVVLIGLIVLYRRKLTDDTTALHSIVGRYKAAVAIFIAFLAVTLYSGFSGGTTRGADIAIFNPTDKWVSVAERRYEAVLQGVPDQIARLFSNKLTYVFDQFSGRYLAYYSPQFLFTQGAGEWTYGMIPGRGVIYLVEMLFVGVAVWVIIQARLWQKPTIKLLLFWLLLAPIPAALAKGPGFAANRAAIVMPGIQILSAFGAVSLFESLTGRARLKGVKNLLLNGSIVILLLSLIFFLEDYIYHAPIQGASNMLYGRKEAVKYANSVEDRYAEIIVSRSLSEPHIFVAFYTQWDPQDYQGQTQDWLRYEKEELAFVDQLGEYRLGNYKFSNIEPAQVKESEQRLFIGKPEEFPPDVIPLKTIYYSNGEPAILLVEGETEAYAKDF